MRNKQLGGYKFRRQHIIFNYIVDFYCQSEKLIVELDGPIHNSTKAKTFDRKREAFLKANRYRVIRFKNSEVFNRENDVLEKILEELRKQ